MPFEDEQKPVVVIDYQPRWREEFRHLAEELREVLGDLAVAIDHVGSTSVPGLAAKDCIDVQVRVRDVADARLASLLTSAGFRLRPEPWNRSEPIDGRSCPKLVFAPARGRRACNVHIREFGSANARFALLFRDYLRANESARHAWGAFKYRLAQTAPDLADYGQIKAPATEVLMQGAERWAAEVKWLPAGH